MLLPIVLLSFHSRPADMHTDHFLSTTHLWLSIYEPVFHLKKKGWYLLINVSDPFFSDKSLKYCDDSESDKKWYLLSDVNSSNSSNLRNSVLSVNFRLHMYIKQQGPSWPVAQYFFMNKYDTLKNGGFRYNSRSTKIQCIKFAYHVAMFVSKFSPVKG